METKNWFNEGNNWFEKGNFSNALDCYERWFDTRVIKDLYAINSETILANSEKILWENPNNARAWKLKGIAYYGLKKYSEAIKCFDKAIEGNPNDVDVYYIKGSTLYHLGEYQQAIKYFDKVIKSNPSDAVAYNDKGIALNSSGKHQQAIECYDKAIELNPGNTALPYNGKGLALDNLGKYQQAIECYDKAIKQDSGYLEIMYHNKGLVLEKLGKYEEAIECYDKAIASSPGYINAYNSKGIALEKLGKYQKAIEYYDTVVKLNPKYVYAYNNKGLALGRLGRYQESIGYYNKAIEIDPNYINAYDNKGWALEKLGKYKEAVKSYEQLLAINPSHYEVATRRNIIILNMPTNEKKEHTDEKLKEFDKLLSYGFAVPFSNIDKNAAADKLEQTMLNNISKNVVAAKLRIEGAVKNGNTNYELQIAQCSLEEFPIVFTIYYYIKGEISPDTASTLLLYCAKKMDNDSIQKFGNVMKKIVPNMNIMFACAEFLSSLQNKNPSTTIGIWTMPNQYDSFKKKLPEFLAEERRRLGENDFRNKYFFVDFLKEYKKLFE